jgi:hypothetical protein
MGAAVLSRADGDVRTARFLLHSHHLAKLDRYLAQAQRHATRSGGQFAGVAVEVDRAGTLSLYAAGLERLVLCPETGVPSRA